MSQMHGWPKTEESARKVFDVVSPETVAKLAADWKALGDAMRAETRADVDAENAMWQALYGDLDDGLDWLGEWGGRRG